MSMHNTVKTILGVAIATLLVSIASAKTLVIEPLDKQGKRTGEVWRVALVGEDEGTYKSTEQRTFYVRKNDERKAGQTHYEAVPTWFGVSVKAKAIDARSVALVLEKRELLGVDVSPDGKESAPNVRTLTFDTVLIFVGKEPVEISASIVPGDANRLAVRLTE